MKLDEKLLQLIACPKCKKELKYLEEKNKLVCENCRVYYPVKDEIPVLLIEEAKPLKDER